MRYHLLLVKTALCLALLPILAHAGDLKPRAEVNVRAGTERSILMTEFWAPLAQQNDRVLYGDLRLMGDDGDNREGNLGFGYRQISKSTNSVLGANAWIDRRRTENGNTFHQLTLGVESLGETIDVRANGYVQLNSSKTIITPNLGSASPYLVGNGIFFDTNGFIIEEPQHGVDAEIGYRVPVLQKYVDATRVYAGGYHFWGKQTDNVTGFRIRSEAQINSVFSVGARFQHDGPRGSQGFLEATLRFPFKSKKLYQEHGLRSRLDESPERDIDIVTGAKVDNGLMKPVVNEATGTQQRILYVDNTNAQAGDGSKDNPFNTLAAAQAALQANDILYINRGDGTTMGMDQGIVIDKANVQLIGSGSALTYNGFTLLDAGLAPVITNTAESVNAVHDTTGSAIIVRSDDVSISGLTLSNMQKHGIYMSALTGESLNGIQIDNLSIYNLDSANNRYSIYVTGMGGAISSISVTNTRAFSGNGIAMTALDGGVVGNVYADNITTSGGSRGVLVNANAGTINTVNLSNMILDNTTDSGMRVQSGSSGYIDRLNIKNINATGHSGSGIRIQASTGGTFNVLNIENTVLNGNATGLRFETTVSSLINQVTVTNGIMSGNSGTGLLLEASAGTVISSFAADNIIANNNGIYGVQFVSRTGGVIGNASLTNATISSNSQSGFQLESNGAASIIGSATASNITATNNTQRGVYVYAASGAINNTVLTDITASNNLLQGVYVYAGNGVISNASLNRIHAKNNGEYGIHAFTQNSTAVITGLSLSNSDVMNNTLGGVYLRRGNVASVLTADLGGGAFGSVGQNRIFGNVGNDLFMDRVTISAGSNWWNNGGAAPTRVTIANSATATYVPPLVSDPRP